MKTTPRVWALVCLVLCGAVGCRLPYTGGAQTISPQQLGSGWYHATATPVVRQHQETDCGLAALAMVAGAWGRTWSVEQLDHQLPPGAKGVKLGVLRDYARAHGLEAYAIKGSRADLEHELSQGRPVVVGLLLPFDQGHNLKHYEVAVAIRPSDGTVVTIDPASGHWLSRSQKVLDLEWGHAGYAALVVVGQRSAALPSGSRPPHASVAAQWPSSSSTTRR